MEDFKNISLDELNNFSGSICLYSLEAEKSLGINVNLEFGRLFQNNIMTYYNSLASESDSDLIIIDGDDFNPSKVFGLTKKYQTPIVIFVSNSSKIEKLKGLLIREILLINKNTLQGINILENVRANLEAKRLKDIEKGIIIEPSLVVEELPPSELELEPNSMIRLGTGEKAIVLTSGFSDDEFEEIKDKDILNDEYNVEVFNANKSDKLEIKENITPKVEVITKEAKLLEAFNKEINHNVTINTIGVFGLNLTAVNALKEIHPNVITVNPDNHNADFYILDISFASPRIFDFINEIMPIPLILISNYEFKFKDIKYKDVSNILKLPRPAYFDEETIRKIYDYLKNYNRKKEEEKIVAYNNNIPKGLQDNPKQAEIRKKYNTYTEDNIPKDAMTRTKEEIYKANKRKDKDTSLEDIYENLGLSKLAMYESMINKEVYTTYDGKVVKYKPNGYLIEIRIERLKSKGLSDRELNSALQRLEEADIRFAQKQLRRIDAYKLNQLKNKK